jgi:hypothetical protein
VNTRTDGLYFLAAMSYASMAWLGATVALSLRSKAFLATVNRLGVSSWSKNVAWANLLGGLILVCALRSVVGAAPASDPVMGMWKLDPSKSHATCSDAGETIRTYRKIGDRIRVSESRGTCGEPYPTEYSVKYDGKEYPVYFRDGSRALRKTGGTMTLTRLDPYTASGTARIGGKIAYTFLRTVSRDGNTLTVRITPAGKPGAEAETVLVYRRIELLEAQNRF